MQSNARASNEGYANGALGLPLSGASALELVEAHDFASAATGYTFSGLDGDADGIYLVKSRIILDAGAQVIYLRPNGVTANQVRSGSSVFGDAYAGLGTQTGATTNLVLVGHATLGLADDDVLFGEGSLDAKTGAVRLWQATYSAYRAADDFRFGIPLVSVWENTADNITSLEVIADAASGIGAGSYVRLYKVTP